jgi:hypothetical protein
MHATTILLLPNESIGQLYFSVVKIVSLHPPFFAIVLDFYSRKFPNFES